MKVSIAIFVAMVFTTVASAGELERQIRAAEERAAASVKAAANAYEVLEKEMSDEAYARKPNYSYDPPSIPKYSWGVTCTTSSTLNSYTVRCYEH